MKKNNFLVGFLIRTVTVLELASCGEEDKPEISASISDFSPEILQGDSALASTTIKGGSPPHAFRYIYFNGAQVVPKNIIDIPERSFTFKTLLSDDVTYVAKSVASYGLVGEASDRANIQVISVTYKYLESITASKAAFMKRSNNELSYSSSIPLRSSNNALQRKAF